MIVKQHLGYWTIFSAGRPLMSCANLAAALKLMLGAA